MSTFDTLSEKLTNLRKAEMAETADLRRQVYEIERRYLADRTRLVNDTFETLSPETVEYLNMEYLHLHYREDGTPMKIHTIREYREEFRITYGFSPPLRWTKQQVDRGFARNFGH